MSKTFKELYNTVTEVTGMNILRPCDLELIKERLMDTKLFEDVLVFKIVRDMSTVKTTLMRPNIDKFNKVINICSIQIVPSLDETEFKLMVNCGDNTILRPEDGEV